MPDPNREELTISLGQFRTATRDLPDDTDIVIRVLSAPFDDETVELEELVVVKGRVSLCVAVIDDVSREIRAEEGRTRESPRITHAD